MDQNAVRLTKLRYCQNLLKYLLVSEEEDILKYVLKSAVFLAQNAYPKIFLKSAETAIILIRLSMSL